VDGAGAVGSRVLRATERDDREAGVGTKGEENDKFLFKGEYIGQVSANGMVNASAAKEGGGRGGGIVFSKN
jgi:hypothetical protein